MKLALTLLAALLLTPLTTLHAAARQGKPLPQALVSRDEKSAPGVEGDPACASVAFRGTKVSCAPICLRPRIWVLVLERVKQK